MEEREEREGEKVEGGREGEVRSSKEGKDERREEGSKKGGKGEGRRKGC